MGERELTSTLIGGFAVSQEPLLYYSPYVARIWGSTIKKVLENEYLLDTMLAYLPPGVVKGS